MTRRALLAIAIALSVSACEKTLAVKTLEPPAHRPVAVELPADEAGEVGWYPALKLGPDGSLHIAYCDKGRGDVRYGFRGSDGVLRLETVAAYGAVGKYVALAVDADNNPHLLYHDQDSKYLKYTTKRDGAWLQTPRKEGELTSLPAEAERHEKLAWGIEVGMGGRLLVHDGKVHALFYANRKQGGQLHLAVRAPLATKAYGDEEPWDDQVVDDADGSWSIAPDFVVDGDRLLASYPHWNFVDSELRLGWRPLAGGEWQTRVLYPMKKKTPGWHSNLLPQPGGAPLIAFTALSRERIYVGPIPAEDNMVDTPILGYFINRMQMAQGGNGDLVMAGAETGKGRLGNSILAIYRRHEGAWSRYPVDTRRPVASKMAIAAGPKGEAIVLYFADTDRGLWLYDETVATRVVDSRPAPAPAASQPASAPAGKAASPAAAHTAK